MSRKIAVIDCGTNTFHLMIAQLEANGDHEILLAEKRLVKIGMGGINDGFITNEAEERALQTIKYFNQKIIEHKVEKTYAFATSAFRNAKNGNQLKGHIKAETDIDINIISGNYEAGLIYHGVNTALNIGNGLSLIMDIGGGSVEFIIASNKEIVWAHSFEIGAQRLMDLFHHNDPITGVEIKNLKAYLNKRLAPLNEKISSFAISTIIGSSGTFDTLSAIFCREQGIPVPTEQTETPLTVGAFAEIYRQLITKNRKERLAIPGMIEMRVDMIVVASIIIDYLIEKHSFDKIRVSTHALKEGVLDRIIKNQL